ncbi:antitoxin MazE-like protein [Gordonia sputi]|uniref:antitoxin MazE-like protein n=1 Tax=Gordonia sputi TaxID=36823 RepID=UPI003556EACE
MRRDTGGDARQNRRRARDRVGEYRSRMRERGLRPVQVRRDDSEGGQAAKTTEPAPRLRCHQRDDISRRGSDDKQSGDAMCSGLPVILDIRFLHSHRGGCARGQCGSLHVTCSHGSEGQSRRVQAPDA